MKIRPGRAELFHADGRTDMTKLTVAFRNFVNVPKISHLYTVIKKSLCDEKLSVCEQFPHN
jgi:hypothetical protein